GTSSSLQALSTKNPEALTPEIIYREAVRGDALSLEVYRSAARFLSIGISNVNNLLDIHTFIVGGGVSKAFHLVEDYLLAETRRRIFDVSRDKIKISVSLLGNDAGVYGGGYLALSSLAYVQNPKRRKAS
ncbi:MAG: ROK family protein, partial [Pseudomonadota bacterium]